MVTNTEGQPRPALPALETHRSQSIEIAMVFFSSRTSPTKEPAESGAFRDFSGRPGLQGALAMGRIGPYTPRALADDSTYLVTSALMPVALAASDREQTTRFSL